MLKFQWNALRIGDCVQVHDDSAAECRLIGGTVVTIETNRSKHAANSVSIRVIDVEGSRVVLPSYFAVHLDPIHVDEDCWRCEELAKATLVDAATPVPGGSVSR